MTRHAVVSPVIAALALVVAAFTTAGATSPNTTDSPAATEAPASSTATRILFMGDSITGGPGCWRALVWVELTDAGHDIDMVGTRHADDCGGVTNAAGQVWDPDHTGIGSITTSGMFLRIARDGLLERTQPDVVVMLLGTNDFWGGQGADHVLSQHQVLVDAIRAVSEREVAIVVGTVLPMGAQACPTCQEQIDLLHARLPEWAEQAGTPQSPVHLATLYPDFDPEVHTWDGVHPNDAGAEIIAAGFTPVIAQALTDLHARDNGDRAWWIAAVLLVIAVTAVGVLRRRASQP